MFRFSSFLDECREREESLSAELERGRLRSEEVNQELGKVLEELGNARMDSHESRLQLQRRELLEKLCRLFPDSVVRHSATGTAAGIYICVCVCMYTKAEQIDFKLV